MIYREFYRELGNLLYAVAKADGKISKKEVEAIKLLVNKELKDFENSTDAFSSDLAFLTEFEFEFDDDQIENAEEAYRSFITFVKANEERIDVNLRKLAFRTAQKVAEVFHHRNKAEHILLKNLKKDLHLTARRAHQRHKGKVFN